jgi:CheY-like chemotaxis protein
MKNYFRILVVDDSLVSRKMTMFDIAQGHRAAHTKELLYLQQASDYDSALEFINSKEFNVIIVNDDLGDVYPRTNGMSLVEIIRSKSPSCVIIGMIEGEDRENKKPTNMTTGKTSAFMRAGADMVWQRPLECPQKAWAQLSQLLPIEF